MSNLIALPTWTTACPDWEARVRAGTSLVPAGPLFPAEAAAALEVFDSLKVVDMPGSPTMGDVTRPWMSDIVASIFGAYNPDSGRRLITEFFVLISKKNTKSTSAAGIMMTAMVRNWRISGEFSILAPTIEIANNSFKPAHDMITHDEELSSLFHVQPNFRRITHRTTGATLQVVAADSDVVGGKKSIGVLVDELWLFGKRPGAENMLREATGGLASRPEGFVIYLTTQSDEPPAGIFKQKLDYARGVRDGRIKDPKFMPVLYEFPDKMVEAGEHRNPKNFYMTNPNLGASVDVEFLEREFGKAVEAGEDSMRGFLAKHLNVQIGMALRTERWAGADHWEANKAERLATLDELLARCEVVVAGVDGGGLNDLLGLAIVGREIGTGKWLLWVHAWAHECVLTRNKGEAPRLNDFKDQGDLTIVGDAADEDVQEVAAFIKQCEDSGLLDRIGVDRAGIGAIVDEIEKVGIEFERIVGIEQGWRLVNAIKTAERKLASRSLLHAGRPIMAYAVANAKVELRGNAIVITKQGSGAGKIDPLMATFNAVQLMSLNPKPRRKQYQSFFVGA